jgi:predicted nucleic acid-binding protein
VQGLREQEEDAALTLFAGLRLVPLGADEGWRAGRWRRSFAARGRTLAQADCLIAAAALSIGGRLATGNPKDFPIPELAIEQWPVGA